mgnify:CR=1 FL=1
MLWPWSPYCHCEQTRKLPARLAVVLAVIWAVKVAYDGSCHPVIILFSSSSSPLGLLKLCFLRYLTYHFISGFYWTCKPGDRVLPLILVYHLTEVCRCTCQILCQYFHLILPRTFKTVLALTSLLSLQRHKFAARLWREWTYSI